MFLFIIFGFIKYEQMQFSFIKYLLLQTCRTETELIYFVCSIKLLSERSQATRRKPRHSSREENKTESKVISIHKKPTKSY